MKLTGIKGFTSLSWSHPIIDGCNSDPRYQLHSQTKVVKGLNLERSFKHPATKGVLGFWNQTANQKQVGFEVHPTRVRSRLVHVFTSPEKGEP